MILSEGTVLNSEDQLRLQRAVQRLSFVRELIEGCNYGIALDELKGALFELPQDTGPCWDWR